MEKIIDKYRRFSDAERGVNKVQQDVLRPRKLSADSGTGFEAPKFLQRLMDGSDFPKLNLDELNQIEKELETALAMTMTRKTLLMMDTIDGLQQKGNALLREINFMQSIHNQDQTKNEGINEAASRDGTQNNGNFEVSREENNTSFPSTVINNTINTGTDTEAPGVFAEDRHGCQVSIHPFL